MKDILKFIPGFRTQNKNKMILAGIYYLLSLLMFSAGIGYFLFLISIPFIFFSIVSLVKNKQARRDPAIILVISFILFCGGVNLIPTAPQTTKQNKVASNTQTAKKIKSEKDNKSKSKSVVAKSKDVSVSGNLKIHYINVGQGDSELIQNNGENMLIDTGTNESTSSLVSYLKSQNVSKIKYLILTHPHEDHIGGADAVIKEFNVRNVYMPNVTTNTRTFKDVVAAMKAKDLKAKLPNVAEEFKVGTAKFKILSPINTNSEDLNTYSIVIKLTFGSTKFLFTGDAQNSNEEDMINKGFDLSADVLKVGHHGSHTSTSQDFLDKVNPRYAIISCGKGNDYGHPHAETMQKLQSKNIKVYRTDEDGTIVCTSDGKNISFNCNPGDYAAGAAKKQNSNNGNSTSSSHAPATSTASTSNTQSTVQPTTPQGGGSAEVDANRIVYYTPNGKSYHFDRNCPTLKRSKVVLSGKLSDVIKMGKSDPCNVCVR